MAMSAVSLKELIETAKQSESDDAVIRLTEAVGGAEQAALSAEADSFRELFELWSDEISHSENKAALIVKLAEKSVMDDADFRTALHYAVRKLLPPYLASGSVVKSPSQPPCASMVAFSAPCICPTRSSALCSDGSLQSS